VRARGQFRFANVHFFPGLREVAFGCCPFNGLRARFFGFRAGWCRVVGVMPRRSDADLSIVPMLPGRGRPEPPKALDQAEARAWNDVVDALPDRFLDPAGQLVLRRVVTQVAIAERLEDRLRRLALMDDDPEALGAEASIAAMHRETAKAVIAGLTVLRATPRSRMAARESRSRFERGAGALRPWEIVARKGDGQAS
jgi:hypothetical protein